MATLILLSASTWTQIISSYFHHAFLLYCFIYGTITS